MSAVLLVASVLCALILGFTGFGWIDASNQLGWLGFSLAFGFGSFLVGAIPWPRP